MTRHVAIVVAGLMAGLPGLARAESAALLPVSGVNVHEGYLAAASSVARDHLEQNGYAVVVAPGAPGAVEMAGADAVSQARAMGARFGVVVHVTRLGASAKVKLTAYDATSNMVSYRGMLTALTPEDLDVVMARLVKGMSTGQPPQDTADIETVTEKESGALNKVQATSVFGVRMSGVMPLNSPDGAGDGMPGLGVFWLYDVRTFLADISLDFHAKDDNGDFMVSLGAYYPFSRDNTTMYAGGGLRYGVTEYGGEGGTGMAAYGAFGLLFGRLSTVQVRGELALFQNFFREREINDTGDLVDSSRNTGVLLSGGLGF
jgi:hypothetical protein